MKKTLIALAIAAVCAQAIAAQAFFTGQMEMTQTVTGKPITRCQYDYLGTKFWRLFPYGTSCPSTVEVE